MLIHLAGWIGLMAASLNAAPVLYTLTFTKTSGAPPGAQFSSFSLTRGTGTVDRLTEPNVNANDPLVALTSAAQTRFHGRVDPGVSHWINISESVAGDLSTEIAGRGDQSFPFGSCPLFPVGPGCVTVAGTLTIALTVPEPATGMLTLFAIAIIATLRRYTSPRVRSGSGSPGFKLDSSGGKTQ